MKRYAALFLMLVLVFSLCSLGWFSPRKETFEGEGFKTVEALIEEYIKCLNDGDANGMLSCYAIESYVDHADVEAYLNRMNSAVPNYPLLIPASSDFSRQILAANRYGKAADQLYRYLRYYTFAGTEYSELAESKTIKLAVPETVHDFVEVGSNSPVNTWKGNVKFIKYADCDELTEGKYSLDRSKENRAKLGKIFGCDEYIDRPCYVEINGDMYLLSFGYGKYDGRWYIIDGGYLNSLMGVEAQLQGLVPMSYFDW